MTKNIANAYVGIKAAKKMNDENSKRKDKAQNPTLISAILMRNTLNYCQ